MAFKVGDRVKIDATQGGGTGVVVGINNTGGGVYVVDVRVGGSIKSLFEDDIEQIGTMSATPYTAAQMAHAISTARAHTFAVGFKVDGEGPFSLADMERDNGDDRALIAKLRGMKPGDRYHAGGGAGADMLIEAVQMARAKGGAVAMGRLKRGDHVVIERGTHSGDVGVVVDAFAGRDGDSVTIDLEDGSRLTISADGPVV